MIKKNFQKKLYRGLMAIFLFIVVTPAFGTKLQHISDQDVAGLREAFKAGESLSLKAISKKPSWDCTLYGMRSRMQVHKKLAFYNFKTSQLSDGQGPQVVNSGAQIVQSYRANSQGLVGKKGPFLDVVKKTKNGELIAEFSIPSRDPSVATNSKHGDLAALADPGRVVVAYARCK